jgi:hypothetical protein
MNPTLKVNRNELQDLLAQLARFGQGVLKAKAILVFEDNQLVIRAPGMELKASASGEWQGQTSVALSLLVSLGESPLPEGNPLEVSVRSGRLHLGSISIPCAWEPRATRHIELPLDPPLASILRVARRHSREEIEAAGLTCWVEKASEKRAELIEAATRQLEQLGVRREEVELLVTKVLEDENRPLPAIAAVPFRP